MLETSPSSSKSLIPAVVVMAEAVVNVNTSPGVTVAAPSSSTPSP